MTRADAHRLLGAVLDRQVSPAELLEFQAFLKSDREFAAFFEHEKATHEALINRLDKIQFESAPAGLRQKITASLDAIDSEEAMIEAMIPASRSTKVTPQFRRNPALRWMALAASLVLAVGIGYFGKGFNNHHAVFSPLEQAHWQAVTEFNTTGKFVHTTVTGKCRESAGKMLSGLGVKLASSVNGMTEVGGCIDDCQCGEFGHFVYADGDKIVSVFVAPSSSFTIPDELTANAVTKDGQTYYDHNCRGCRLVYQRVGDVIVVTATTNRKVELVGLEPVVI